MVAAVATGTKDGTGRERTIGKNAQALILAAEVAWLAHSGVGRRVQHGMG